MVYYNSFGNVFGTHVEKVGNQRSVDIRQKDGNEDELVVSAPVLESLAATKVSMVSVNHQNRK